VTELVARAEVALAGAAWGEAAALAGEALAGAVGRQRRQARVIRAQALLQVPGGRKPAEDELKVALEEDPANAEAHYQLGVIYKGGGALSLAAASFRRALALRPRHAGALSAMEELEPRSEPNRADVIKKLFR
jgi:Tfp pilus assembly protein PilF